MANKHFHDFPGKSVPDDTDIIAIEQDPSGSPLMVKTTWAEVKSAVAGAVGSETQFDTLADLKADTNLVDRKEVVLLGNLVVWDLPNPVPRYIYDALCPDGNNDGDRVKPTAAGVLGCYRQIS